VPAGDQATASVKATAQCQWARLTNPPAPIPQVTAVAMLEAASALLAQGWSPTRDVIFAFGHDEEVGGKMGAGKFWSYCGVGRRAQVVGATTCHECIQMLLGHSLALHAPHPWCIACPKIESHPSTLAVQVRLQKSSRLVASRWRSSGMRARPSWWMVSSLS
jgi:hypothetical protein